MFKTKYYYIIAGLSDLVLEQSKLHQSIQDFKLDMMEHLTSKDYELLETLFLTIDNKNLLNILQKNKAEFIQGGKYSEDEINEGIKELSLVPSYFNRFIDAYKSDLSIIENLSWEDQLTSLYYDYMINIIESDFLNKYYEFEQHINNIIAALNSRKFDISSKSIFIGNNEITDALKRSTLKDFGISNEFQYIDKLISIFEESHLVSREKSIDKLKWDYINELNTFNYFTIEQILGFTIKIKMIERWLRLDEERGLAMFNKLIGELNSSFEFSKEFTINKRK